MKSMLNKKWVKKLSLLVGLTGVTVFIGHGCSKLSGQSTVSMSQTPLGTTVGGSDGAGGTFTPIPGATTTALVYNKQLVDNMVSCAGTGTPSVTTLDEWNRRQSSFSEYGYALDITAPMLMAVAALGGEVCNDLLKIESALPAANRRIFNSIDFTQGPAGINAAGLADATRRLARSCWARNEESTEQQIINEEINLAIAQPKAGTTGPEQTKALALMLCTGVMASLSGVTL